MHFKSFFLRTALTLSVAIVIFTLSARELNGTHPLSPSDGTLRRIRVPILMYHYVSPLPPEADDIRIDLTIAPDLFRDHLQYLADNGYASVSLYEVTDALLKGYPLPAKPVVLTFDDSYIDHYQYVFPALKEHSFTGTFFVITAYADRAAHGHLTWQHITEMAANGMDMEAHTKNHLDLRDRDRDFLVYEILGSLESISAHTNLPGSMFAYPGGRYDESTLNAIEALSIEAALTTRHGAYITTSDLLEMPRLRVSGGMSVVGLAHLLNARE